MVKDFRIFLKGEERTEDIIRYQKVGNKYNVVFNSGKQYTYAAYNVKIVESALKDKNSKVCFEYLKADSTIFTLYAAYVYCFPLLNTTYICRI